MIAYLAALAPIIFGTTYLLTSDFLPPGRPLLAALLRSLPTGLILVVGTRPPDRRWLRPGSWRLRPRNDGMGERGIGADVCRREWGTGERPDPRS